MAGLDWYKKESGVQGGITFMKQIIANPHPDLERRVNGRTGLSRLEGLLSLHEQAVRTKQLDGYERLREPAAAEIADFEETLQAVIDKVESLSRDLDAGRIEDVDGVIRDIAASVKAINATNASLDRIDTDGEIATAHVDTSPEDFENGLIERFPSSAKALPTITEAFLLGEPDAPDPLGKAKKPDAGDPSGVSAFLQTGSRGEDEEGEDGDD